MQPDVLSIGLGGGSLLRFPDGGPGGGEGAEGGGSGSCSVGPDSVGARLLQEAACCGGAALTASDAAVAMGHMALGDAGLARAALGGGRAERACQAVQAALWLALDAAKMQAGGGGCWGPPAAGGGPGPGPGLLFLAPGLGWVCQ